MSINKVNEYRKILPFSNAIFIINNLYHKLKFKETGMVYTCSVHAFIRNR